ncbi:hypothetical protein [Shewanella surugensis]|uniref:Transmembrane protein n=1 Tax=Shewanella surugensis TaxID=212020 RepID=A0ABT0L6F4_9GAMM|nr:hypothetical protein [Shewanella surugensis]MCL1123271.1 hypothetical protein [Shewanella surugensis]
MNKSNLVTLLLFIVLLLQLENNMISKTFFVHFSLLELSFQLEVSLFEHSAVNGNPIDGMQQV